MPLIPALRTFAAGALIKSADVNANFALLRDTLNASGVFSDVAATLTAPWTFEAELLVDRPTAPNGATASMVALSAGSDTTLGPLRASLELRPSATAGNRFGQLSVGDTAATRPLQLRTERVYIGASSTPAFVADEALGVAGDVRASRDVIARALTGLSLSAANDTPATALTLTRGDDPTLGPLTLHMALQPSAAGGSRFARLEVGDNAALRKLGVKASQVFLGSIDAAFIGAERLRVQGSVRVDDGLVAATYTGAGSGLTDIPQAAVVGLPGVLAALGAWQAATTAAVDGKAATVHQHSAADITAGELAVARLTVTPRDVGTAGATPPLTRPGAWAAYAWEWLEVRPGLYLPLLKGGNL